jgi:hypothetical protein
MDVIGARFVALPAATEAREAILASVAVPPADVAVHPLGSTRYDAPVEAYLLAGRFASASAETVVRVIREHGGTILSRRTEWRPRARMVVATAAQGRTAARGRPAGSRHPVRKRPRRPAARLRVRAARSGRRCS